MTELDLHALKKLCEAATPGPWEAVPSVGAISRETREGGSEDVIEADRYKEEDLYFIAAARTALPQLIEEVERLRTDKEPWGNEFTAVHTVKLENAALKAEVDLLISEKTEFRILCEEEEKENQALRELLKQAQQVIVQSHVTVSVSFMNSIDDTLSLKEKK